MGIAYSPECIAIIDDRNPSRPPLLLPATATQAEIESAALEYLQPEPEPDYDGFGLWLLTTPEILAAYDAAFAGNKLTAGTLPSAVLAAAGGEPKHLRTTLLLLHGQGLLGQETIGSMLAKAQECSLPPEFLQAMQCDAPAPRLVRARDEEGQYEGDDPSTPDVNEAWVEVEQS
jgi:hypothetical protein